MIGRIRNTILSSNRGFTLIELLAVMAIVGVLAGIVTTAVSGTGDKSTNAQIETDAGTVFSAASTYFTEQDTPVSSAFTHDVLGIASDQNTSNAWPELPFGENIVDGTANAYAAEFPSDVNNVASITLLDDSEGSVFFKGDLSSFLTSLTAIDLSRISTVPASADTLFNDAFHNYIWAFEKSGDERNIVVFRITSVSVNSDGKSDLVYTQIVG